MKRSLFSTGIHVLEQHTTLLRAVEARVQQYSDYLTSVRKRAGQYSDRPAQGPDAAHAIGQRFGPGAPGRGIHHRSCSTMKPSALPT